MATATQQQQQPSATAGRPSSAEEEALKRNTDCVYFLASPLTCKKGSECEYRHSEYARVNPRDCYFWLNGNCLNPKCGFRHPPLDGLMGTQVAASTGSSISPLHTAVTPAAHASYSSGKQSVPCIFFQKGLCLKGDRCAFSHGLNPTSNKVSQPKVSTPVTEPSSIKKGFCGLQKCSQEQKIPTANFLKAADALAEAKTVPKANVAPRRNDVGIEKNVLPRKSKDDEVPYKAANVPPVVNGNSSHSSRLDESQVADDHGFQNVKDAEEFLRESSPGFDVLVDDEMRDSDYYHGEDQYGRTIGHEGRNLNTVDEYDMGHSADYSSMADIDKEAYRNPRGYDSNDRMQGLYGWEQHRTSSERMTAGSAQLERRGYLQSENPEHIDELDLRYHLSKQRRVNGLRSVVNHDFVSDDHGEEQAYRGSSRRDSHHLPSRESSISSRLRGRIKLPGRSPNNGSDLPAEKETDMSRNWARLSPGRSQVSTHQGRLRDRIKARVEDDYNNEGRNFRRPHMRREIMDDGNADFAGPKSLAELKVVQNAEGRLQRSLGKRKHLEGNQPLEGDLAFEGPMPLSEILKRKREAEAAASGSGTSSVNKHENNPEESKEKLIGSSQNKAFAETQSGLSSAFKNQAQSHMLTDKEEPKSATAENVEVARRQSSLLPNLNEVDGEDGMIVGDGMGDDEYAGDDQRDVDYEYDQVDGDYNYEEGENVDPEDGDNAVGEEEYVDDEDGDDFAKKIGVMFS